MGSKIYVGGLPYSTTEQQLSDLFAAHGRWRQPESLPISSPASPEASASWRCPGIREAQAAIAALNGTQLGGRTLTVNEARPQNHALAAEAAAGSVAAGIEAEPSFSCRGCLTGSPANILPRIAHLSDAFLGRMIGRLAVPGS